MDATRRQADYQNEPDNGGTQERVNAALRANVSRSAWFYDLSSSLNFARRPRTVTRPTNAPTSALLVVGGSGGALRQNLSGTTVSFAKLPVCRCSSSNFSFLLTMMIAGELTS